MNRRLMRLVNREILAFLIIPCLLNSIMVRTETLYCSLHFIVDYPLWTLTFTTRADHDYFRTNILLSTYIYRNVEGLNELYSHYRFPYMSMTKNVTVQFFVHGITIVTEKICNQQNISNNDDYSVNPLREFCASNINSDALLDLVVRFSNHHKETSEVEPACLYYGFTSRKLKLMSTAGAALGWSWRGHLCTELHELKTWSSEKLGFNPKYAGNVGVVAVSFDGTDYSLNKGEMTFFHEIGHSMNADHDDSEVFKARQLECAPADTDGGSYLMFHAGTEGLLPNNRFYSHCTLDSIAKYVESLSRRIPKCLSSLKMVHSKCDGIYSMDEICDEQGTSSTCCTSDCKLKPGALCSPSAGSCCASSCQFYPSGHECRPDSECKLRIPCLGTSATCPEDDRNFFKPDKTVCQNGTLLCINGSCELSVCALHSLLPCQLEESEDILCMIACRQRNGLCTPYHTIGVDSYSSTPLYFPYGSMCNSNRGYCDQLHKCIPLLADDTTNFISTGFTSLLLTDYTTVFRKYWWIFVIFILAQTILIPVILRYFHSTCIPSDNPFLQ